MQIRKCLIDYMSQSERGVKHRNGAVSQKSQKNARSAYSKQMIVRSRAVVYNEGVS